MRYFAHMLSSFELPGHVREAETAKEQAAPAWHLTRSGRWALALLYALAGFYLVRLHLLNTVAYLNLDRYVAGAERLPYQERVLPMLYLRAAERVPLPMALLRGRHGIFAHPALIWLFVLDLLALATTASFTVRLYRRAAPEGRYVWLVFPVLLFAASWTFLLHSESNLYFPYDLPSLAFFTVGLYAIYMRQFAALLLVMTIGSLNRETTLFLIPLYVLDAFPPVFGGWPEALRRFSWLKVLVLFVVWLFIRSLMAHLFQANDRSEDFIRLRYNLRYLPPNNWPQMLGACGYLLPVLWVLRRRVPDVRLRSYLLLLPLWFLVMCVYGVLSETRIYGELCGLVAVVATLLLEAYGATAGVG